MRGEALVFSPGGDREPLTFGDYLGALRDDDEFRARYTRQLLADAPAAFFWEHPPLTRASLDRPAIAARLPAPTLATRRQDPGPFAEHFSRRGTGDIVRFANLGGDAELVAPCPAGDQRDYAHLAAFLRTAPDAQQRAFWRETARATLARVGDDPLWLSTSGLGVAWLHARLDSTPKYIQHAPFRRV